MADRAPPAAPQTPLKLGSRAAAILFPLAGAGSAASSACTGR